MFLRYFYLLSNRVSFKMALTAEEFSYTTLAPYFVVFNVGLGSQYLVLANSLS